MTDTSCRAMLLGARVRLVCSPLAPCFVSVSFKRIYSNKSELLLVLERPDIPLHNHGAENAIREYIKRHKISGVTRSDKGRKCRDTFTSLK